MDDGDNVVVDTGSRPSTAAPEDLKEVKTIDWKECFTTFLWVLAGTAFAAHLVFLIYAGSVSLPTDNCRMVTTACRRGNCTTTIASMPISAIIGGVMPFFFAIFGRLCMTHRKNSVIGLGLCFCCVAPLPYFATSWILMAGLTHSAIFNACSSMMQISMILVTVVSNVTLFSLVCGGLWFVGSGGKITL
eukprot:TRINITY_DN14175_c0_g1_i1.p1 TRINITY_DN14175_c0_g1~~TRINITY_DN14175_c0_g1_i1.p1  ORF type:complete len:189 (-),score=48.83 TRINITY_DN14175_c0_g1_i1:103-669(-)